MCGCHSYSVRLHKREFQPRLEWVTVEFYHSHYQSDNASCIGQFKHIWNPICEAVIIENQEISSNHIQVDISNIIWENSTVSLGSDVKSLSVQATQMSSVFLSLDNPSTNTITFSSVSLRNTSLLQTYNSQTKTVLCSSEKNCSHFI